MATPFEAWLLPVICVWVRLFGATLGVPAFSFFRVPKVFFNLLLLGLAVPVASLNALAMPASSIIGSEWNILLLLLAELVTGLILGFGLTVAFAAIDACGHLLDAQSGLGIAHLLGFTNKRPQPITAAFFSTTAICLFFAADLHYDFLSAVLMWYRMAPPSYVMDQLSDPIQFATQLHHSFSFGILIAMPLAAILLLSDILLAFAARSMPQLNVIFLSFPIKLLMILFGMVAVSYLMGPVFIHLLDQIGLRELR